MNISSNQFTKRNFLKVSASWTDTDIVSGNAMTRKQFNKSMQIWQGDNTSEGAFGAQDIFGGLDSVFGTSPFESQAHFKLRTNYDLSH